MIKRNDSWNALVTDNIRTTNSAAFKSANSNDQGVCMLVQENADIEQAEVWVMLEVELMLHADSAADVLSITACSPPFYSTRQLCLWMSSYLRVLSMKALPVRRGRRARDYWPSWRNRQHMKGAALQAGEGLWTAS